MSVCICINSWCMVKNVCVLLYTYFGIVFMYCIVKVKVVIGRWECKYVIYGGDC